MKKRYILYAVFLILAVVIVSAATTVFNRKPEVKNTLVNEALIKKADIADKPTITEQENNYLVKLNNGNLNVYDWNNNIVETLVVNFEAMREYDKKLFKEGIVVKNIEEIKHIAEDFSE